MVKVRTHWWKTQIITDQWLFKCADNKTMAWEVPKVHHKQGRISWARVTQQSHLRSHFIINEKHWFQTCFVLTVLIFYSPYRIHSSSLPSCASDKNSSLAGQGQPLLPSWASDQRPTENTPQGCSVSNPMSTCIHLYPGASLARSNSSL